MEHTCLLCGIRGLVKHEVAMLVTATRGACLGKYLTMPYLKNALKPILLLSSVDKHGIALIFH